MRLRRSRAGGPADADPPEARTPGRRGLDWLRPTRRTVDRGPDYAVRVATLPDLELFADDGPVPREMARSWLALQQFGEAMLLVSWLAETPVGYLLVSWTGDWDDEVRAAYPDVPALGNLWADETHADAGIERRLVEAALSVCERQGKQRLLATVAADGTAVRTELTDLGFTDTGLRTTERFVYRGADGRRRRGVQENVVLERLIEP